MTDDADDDDEDDDDDACADIVVHAGGAVHAGIVMCTQALRCTWLL